MARIGQFVSVTDIRGKLGGQVFTAAKSGPTLRIRVKGKNPQTVSQTAARSFLAQASKIVHDYTTSEATAWQAYSNTITKHSAISGAAYHSAVINTVVPLASFYAYTNGGSLAAFPTTPPATDFTGDTIGVAFSSPSTGVLEASGSGANATDVVTAFRTKLIPTTWAATGDKPYPLTNQHAYSGAGAFTVATGLKSGSVYAVAYQFILKTTGQVVGEVKEGVVTIT